MSARAPVRQAVVADTGYRSVPYPLDSRFPCDCQVRPPSVDSHSDFTCWPVPPCGAQTTQRVPSGPTASPLLSGHGLGVFVQCRPPSTVVYHPDPVSATAESRPSAVTPVTVGPGCAPVAAGFWPAGARTTMPLTSSHSAPPAVEPGREPAPVSVPGNVVRVQCRPPSLVAATVVSLANQRCVSSAAYSDGSPLCVSMPERSPTWVQVWPWLVLRSRLYRYCA